MKNKIKYIYFFRGDLSAHVDIYKSWVDVVKDEINISMITIIDSKTYKLQKELVDHYRKLGVEILIAPRFMKRIYTIYYFTYLLLTYSKIVVHLRKQSPQSFDFLKKIFQNKLKYVIEIEGDFQSELEYLSDDKNKYNDGFYDNIISGMQKSSKILEQQLDRADGIFAVTEELKKLFVNRYTKYDLENKISVIPTGFDTNKFFPDENLRNNYRQKYNLQDKFVLIFTGNVFYSWQNIKRSLEVFILLKETAIYENMIFVLLIRKQDHDIIDEFIKKLNISDNDYLLSNVSHGEVNGFLNASDLGVLLRENHTLNKVASPGKLGEYLSAGLDVLTTKHIGNYSVKMESANIGILIDDIFNDNEILGKVRTFKNNRTKEELSKWASDNFSVQKYKQTYIDALESL